MAEPALKIPTHPLQDKEFLGCFLRSVKDVFEIQAGVSLKDFSPRETKLETFNEYAIGSVLPLRLGEWVGSIAICFSKDAYLEVYSKLLGETYTEINEEIQDGACELLNMIFGGAKTKLNEMGYKFEMARPFLVSSEQVHDWSTGIKVDFSLDVGSGEVFFGIQWVYQGK
ncbi:MAG: chemotaxis protein CheX [Bdellovibrionales bacterium]|nr:chemotaxis protein CheX [Bdellovibrionales bacterium]